MGLGACHLVCMETTCTGNYYECDCSSCAAEMRAEHEAEMYAEGAWLRHAERPDPDGEIEREREANDPGLIWLANRR